MIFKLKDQNFRFWFAVIAMGSLFWLWDWLLQCSNMYFWWMAFKKWFGLHFHFFSSVSNIFVLRFNLQLVFLSFLGNFKPCDWSMRISLIILLVLLSDKMPIGESNTAIHAQEIAYFSDLTTNCKTKNASTDSSVPSKSTLPITNKIRDTVTGVSVLASVAQPLASVTNFKSIQLLYFIPKTVYTTHCK